MIQNRSVLDWPKGTTVYKPDRCYNGFTIINPFLSRTVYLVNMTGDVVHQWQISETEDGGEPLYSDFIEKQAGDSLLSILWRSEKNFARHDDICQNRLVQFNWDGEVVWRYLAPNGVAMHHDIERLVSGNTVILGSERRKFPEISKNIIFDDYYREINNDGEIIWEWFTCDHFDEFGFSDEEKRLMYDAGGDLFHTNTCTVLPANPLGRKDSRFAAGNILGSQRNLGQIFIVDRASGKVVWRWGTHEDGLIGQHHPTMLHNGNILIYDNGGSSGYPLRYRAKTRLIEIEPSTGEIIWEYGYEYNMRLSSKFSGASWGSAQRLPNGNTLSLDTHSGRVFEVTAFGEIVWEFINPFPWGATLKEGNRREIEYGMYRVFRYAYEDFPEVHSRYVSADGFDGKRRDVEHLPERMGLTGPDPE
jgi:outer membrane protein assembly factor BamB